MAQNEDKHKYEYILENKHKHEINVENKHKHDKHNEHKHKHEKQKDDKNNNDDQKKRKRRRWFEHEKEQLSTSTESGVVCESCKIEELPTELFYRTYQLVLISLICMMILLGMYLAIRYDHKDQVAENDTI